MVVYVESECKTKKQLVYQVVQHCFNKLMSQYDVDIFITLKPNLNNNLNGWCQHNYRNNFEIAVDGNLPTNELIRTVCHEMVHVKQGVKNELSNTDNKYCRVWKGVEYKNEHPWEVEAYKLEKQLFSSFMEQYSEKK